MSLNHAWACHPNQLLFFVFLFFLNLVCCSCWWGSAGKRPNVDIRARRVCRRRRVHRMLGAQRFVAPGTLPRAVSLNKACHLLRRFGTTVLRRKSKTTPFPPLRHVISCGTVQFYSIGSTFLCKLLKGFHECLNKCPVKLLWQLKDMS